MHQVLLHTAFNSPYTYTRIVSTFTFCTVLIQNIVLLTGKNIVLDLKKIVEVSNFHTKDYCDRGKFPFSPIWLPLRAVGNIVLGVGFQAHSEV